MTPIYYKGAQAICLVYDCTSTKTFDALEFWVNEIKERVDVLNACLFVVASKVDLANDEEVSVKVAGKYA